MAVDCRTNSSCFCCSLLCLPALSSFFVSCSSLHIVSASLHTRCPLFPRTQPFLWANLAWWACPWACRWVSQWVCQWVCQWASQCRWAPCRCQSKELCPPWRWWWVHRWCKVPPWWCRVPPWWWPPRVSANLRDPQLIKSKWTTLYFPQFIKSNWTTLWHVHHRFYAPCCRGLFCKCDQSWCMSPGASIDVLLCRPGPLNREFVLSFYFAFVMISFLFEAQFRQRWRIYVQVVIYILAGCHSRQEHLFNRHFKADFECYGIDTHNAY